MQVFVQCPAPIQDACKYSYPGPETTTTRSYKMSLDNLHSIKSTHLCQFLNVALLIEALQQLLHPYPSLLPTYCDLVQICVRNKEERLIKVNAGKVLPQIANA